MRDGIDQELRSTAFHESGHAIVALELGLDVGIIRIDNDDVTKGNTDISRNQGHLSIIDRLAICFGGIAAQELFECPLANDQTLISDMAKVDEIIGDMPDHEGEALRDAGHRRAMNILERHKLEIVRLASELIEKREINSTQAVCTVRQR